MFEARFQSFEDRAERAASGPRLAALRTELARRGLTGFIVPRSDRHQNEYVPASEQRLAWLTGFSGSAGIAIVLMERALLFVDGRYTLQAREQVDTSLFTIEHLVDTPPDRWIEENLTAGDRIGYDPWLHTVEGTERLGKACAAAGAMLVAVEPDLIDAIWADRPAPPLGAVTLHDVRFGGEAAEDKRARIHAEVAKLRADALVVSDPHAVAWAFNIRGADVAHTPLPLAFAVVPQAGRPSLYVDGRKLSNKVRNRLEALADVREPSDFVGALGALGRQKQTVRLDQATAADALARLITSHGGKVTRGPCPIALMKAVQNEIEIAGARAAHMRDRFTRVLKGHIAIARAIFPEGTTGAQLDSFARQFLWAQGLDFDHGTGHGVGSYLSVHEGPARISKLGTAALKPGMILSNEPGYYKAGAYGIRIENLALVVAAAPVAGGEKPLDAFETLTLAPIDRRLILPELLTPEETAWLDRYHARVVEALSPLLDADSRAWLTAAARPLGRP